MVAWPGGDGDFDRGVAAGELGEVGLEELAASG